MVQWFHGDADSAGLHWLDPCFIGPSISMSCLDAGDSGESSGFSAPYSNSIHALFSKDIGVEPTGHDVSANLFARDLPFGAIFASIDGKAQNHGAAFGR